MDISDLKKLRIHHFDNDDEMDDDDEEENNDGDNFSIENDDEVQGLDIDEMDEEELLTELDFIVDQMNNGEEYDKEMLEFLLNKLDLDAADLDIDQIAADTNGDSNDANSEYANSITDESKMLPANSEGDTGKRLSLSKEDYRTDRVSLIGRRSVSRPSSCTGRDSFPKIRSNIWKDSPTERESYSKIKMLASRRDSLTRPLSCRNIDRSSFRRQSLRLSNRESMVFDNEQLLNYEELQLEIELFENKHTQGIAYDNAKLQALYEIRSNHPVYIDKLQREHNEWKKSVEPFCFNCLLKMRSYVPVNVFTASLDALQKESGLSLEVSKRILSKQCLWIVRMPFEELVRLHEADISTRYSISGQSLDLIEIAAIYSCLPDDFFIDRFNKKSQWKQGIEATFKSMYDDYCQGNLPVEKIRHSVYMNYSVSSNRSDSSATSEPPQLIDVASCPTGPITDLLGVRKYELIIAISPTTYRKSFRDVCKEFSIINKFKADE